MGLGKSVCFRCVNSRDNHIRIILKITPTERYRHYTYISSLTLHSASTRCSFIIIRVNTAIEETMDEAKEASEPQDAAVEQELNKVVRGGVKATRPEPRGTEQGTGVDHAGIGVKDHAVVVLMSKNASGADECKLPVVIKCSVVLNAVVCRRTPAPWHAQPWPCACRGMVQ